MKNIHTNAFTEYALDTTNYIVPHDFDDFKFAWVEFLSEKERNICVYSFEKMRKYSYLVDKKFGHISYLRLLANNKLFIVRNLNKCEIRDLNMDFKVLHSFNHLGDEVIAVDLYVNSSKIMLNEMELQNIKVKNKYNYNTEDYLKIPIKQINQDDNDVKGVEGNKNIDEENISIVLLDIDGNVNIWENLSITKKFNLYDIKEIDKDYKDKQFFSMGYPYFIKANQNYYAISTDHGVFVITYND
jgi:hypothetical protein